MSICPPHCDATHDAEACAASAVGSSTSLLLLLAFFSSRVVQPQSNASTCSSLRSSAPAILLHATLQAFSQHVKRLRVAPALQLAGAALARRVLTKAFRVLSASASFVVQVLRTPSGNLPVYSRIRKHGTVVTTIIRHAMGDISALKKDLLAICEAPVRERCGTLEVKGLHVLKIKQWLTHLGF
ncbi:hypothetical protein Esti_003348 [Eimeria stiedai]